MYNPALILFEENPSQEDIMHAVNLQPDLLQFFPNLPQDFIDFHYRKNNNLIGNLDISAGAVFANTKAILKCARVKKAIPNHLTIVQLKYFLTGIDISKITAEDPFSKQLKKLNTDNILTKLDTSYDAFTNNAKVNLRNRTYGFKRFDSKTPAIGITWHARVEDLNLDFEDTTRIKSYFRNLMHPKIKDLITIGMATITVYPDYVFIDEIQSDFQKPIKNKKLTGKQEYELYYNMLRMLLIGLIKRGHTTIYIPTTESQRLLGFYPPSYIYTDLPRRNLFRKTTDPLHNVDAWVFDSK